jgi:hypothetical protein
VPDPVRVSTVGVLAALVMMEMLPDATPLVRGVKIRFNDVLWPGPIVVGRDIPARWNSELVVVTEERVTLDSLAVRVTVRVLLVPTVTLPKFKSVALGVNWPAEMPVAERGIVRFEFEASESTVISPLPVPSAFGLKPTPKVTLCPFSRLKGRFNPVKRNAVPESLTCEMVTIESPELVNISY